jgi:ATPase family associated with various cellular activities (AAA)
MRSVSIVGPPGSGKTTVGRALSEAMGVPFVELDKLSIGPAEANLPALVPGAQSRDDNGAAVGNTSVPTGVAMRGKSAIHRDRA